MNKVFKVTHKKDTLTNHIRFVFRAKAILKVFKLIPFRSSRLLANKTFESAAVCFCS